MTKKEVKELVTIKYRKIENCNYKETIKYISTLSEDMALAPIFKEINKDSINYLTSEYPTITLTE
ncbi:hypothetical protein [Metaclostridioides mangenotii]|uniref:hypothetical protein n=1 Tax=Metaclostridioides mangenotii TaxID=1540 RepID=UPI0026EDAD73|nr:hypothetical protein [Clostridioides mangenotii]